MDTQHRVHKLTDSAFAYIRIRISSPQAKTNKWIIR